MRYPSRPRCTRSCTRWRRTGFPPARGSFRWDRPTASACWPCSSRSSSQPDNARWMLRSTISAAQPFAPISPACCTRRSIRDCFARDNISAAPCISVRRPGVRRDDIVVERASNMSKTDGPLRIGIGGPVGSGKTALMDLLCKAMRERYDIAAITNDIYTKWDAEFLVRSGSLTADRIAGVETGGCPHTAIREDASMNLAAVADMRAKFPGLDMVLIESGGDNLAATFSPELADLTIYVIDVSAGDKIPRKGGPGITRSDMLVINKVDLAPFVGASLEVMDRDAKKMRGGRPFVFANVRAGKGVREIASFIEAKGGLRAQAKAC